MIGDIRYKLQIGDNIIYEGVVCTIKEIHRGRNRLFKIDNGAEIDCRWVGLEEVEVIY